MNKCQNCKNNCCGNKFIGLKSAFKHTNSDIFCQILLSQEEVNRIVEFGGEIFMTNGSHGCLNLPLDSAAAIYNYVHTGYPVICYYY